MWMYHKNWMSHRCSALQQISPCGHLWYRSNNNKNENEKKRFWCISLLELIERKNVDPPRHLLTRLQPVDGREHGVSPSISYSLLPICSDFVRFPLSGVIDRYVSPETETRYRPD
ncbi:hypothetical protein F2P81_002316 [Scophthalmus maximus]|uniref:Uncharacterized protein n=1 Tax=Scophthalmus maximus TaxID=52904 RepID=A0A6A4TGH8_SCOMX|nr:hypothetical protein F2P81_002316 [Scophthalmus maximus]